ncbi:PAS domain-containing protein [Rufibacter sp. LB8]|uniref:PAS domain-containing protein n=1 Tax=Rufibacter sp. LB8 TaxID=2777781 RepID=UPI00178C5D29|nr:PAS domain-containing protein [Rufibacter sp. LB8]
MDFFDYFNHVPENIVIISPAYEILAATDMYLKTTMRNRDEILGKHWLKEVYVDPTVAFEDNPVAKCVEKAKATKEVVYLEVFKYDLERPASEGGGFETRYWEAAHTPVLDQAGNVKFLYQSPKDVTERELAKKASKESEEKFKFLTDTVPQLIHTAEPNGHCTFVNQRWLDFTGLSAGEFQGDNWHKVIHPEDLGKVVERQKEAIHASTEFQAEMRIKTKDGHYRWHLMRSMPMRDDQGNVIMRVGSANDIHATKQMVQELLESNEQMSALSDQVQKAFRSAEDRRVTLEQMIMQVPALINITKGPEHRFELVNPQYQRLFPNRQLVGKTTAEALPEAVEQGFIQILDNVYSTGEQFIAYEIPFFSDWYDDGNVQEHYFTITYLPLVEDKKVTGIITFGYIVSDTVKLRKELEELQSAK